MSVSFRPASVSVEVPSSSTKIESKSIFSVYRLAISPKRYASRKKISGGRPPLFDGSENYFISKRTRADFVGDSLRGDGVLPNGGSSDSQHVTGES